MQPRIGAPGGPLSDGAGGEETTTAVMVRGDDMVGEGRRSRGRFERVGEGKCEGARVMIKRRETRNEGHKPTASEAARTMGRLCKRR